MLQINNLVGFGAGGSGPTSFSVPADGISTADAITVAIPTGAAEGDLAVMYDMPWEDVTTGEFEATPAGWNFVHEAMRHALDDVGIKLTYKVLEASDLGTSVSGYEDTSGTKARRKFIVVFRPDAKINDVTVSYQDINNANGGVADVVMTTTGLSLPMVICAGYSTRDATTVSLVPTEDGQAYQELDAAHCNYLLYDVGDTPATTVTASMVDTNDGDILSGVVFTFS